MRTARTFTLSLLVAAAAALGVLGAAAAVVPVSSDHVTVTADGTPPDDTHW
jgi:hypothetical protein